MKRLLEPIVGVITSMSTFVIWRDFVFSLVLAFFGGALAYLGKWMAAKIIAHFTKNQNVFKSRTRQIQNEALSQDDDIII